MCRQANRRRQKRNGDADFLRSRRRRCVRPKLGPKKKREKWTFLSTSLFCDQSLSVNHSITMYFDYLDSVLWTFQSSCISFVMSRSCEHFVPLQFMPCVLLYGEAQYWFGDCSHPMLPIFKIDSCCIGRLFASSLLWPFGRYSSSEDSISY